VCPARAAVLGDVLVPDVSKIVNPINVVPDESLWKFDIVKGFFNNGIDGISGLSSARVDGVHILESGLLRSSNDC